MDLNQLKELLQILEEKEIAEFELEESGMKLRIRKAAASHNQASSPSATAASAGLRPADAATLNPSARPQPAMEGPSEEAGLVVVKSPIVGTFFRAADPSSPPFVSAGDNVTVGQILCIIEAMKLMNEIEAEVAGEIVKIHPESGQPVQYGEPLFSLRPAR